MAPAGRDATTATWISLAAAHPRIIKICVSPSRAPAWVAEKIATEQLGWRAVNMADAGEGFWSDAPPPEVNFADCSAQRWIVHSPRPGFRPCTLYGIEIDLQYLERVGGTLDPDAGATLVRVVGLDRIAESLARWGESLRSLLTSLVRPRSDVPEDGEATSSEPSRRPQGAALNRLPERQRIFWTIVNRHFPIDAGLAATPVAAVQDRVADCWDDVRAEIAPSSRALAPSWDSVNRWLGRAAP